ncbi:sex comb on midleg-like protein 1 isoform X1 [Bubalus bubalis]|uniref:sex comb on midleg-like protein 1 isoform X1 n=1 Tax=Bubalus bubalis TaxID=89462 RepID=UPI000DBC731A|nr:sex comb on midleg-like protein 1 isoform X1 [Bubalus bubalis]XP_025131595.1 sex comb on midleg-like protein 1 isoform X1 [Bubalus bubalis]
MSSGSSEVDVIRTRIPAYDDDNIVLYAYEPNTAYFSNQETAVSDTSFNEEQTTIQDILVYCQAIYDAIQDLDKKFDVIHGKVSKIHRSRCRVKSKWQSRKLHGNKHKNNCQHSRKSKSHKRRRRDCPSSLSLTESYSPTIPTSRRDDDSQSNTLGTSIESQKSPEREQESFFQDQEPDLSHSPTIYTQSYEPYEYVQEEPMQGPSYCSSPQAHNFFPLNQAIVTLPAAILPQMEPEPIPPPNVVTYPPLFDPQPSMHDTSPPYTLDTYAPTSPVRNNPDFFQENIPEDPSTWSVDEVIMFLQDVDPQTLDPLVDLFRNHRIDGKALLLLRSDMMIKYMGLKVGTALKICHYIDRLKKEGYIPNS